MRLTNHLISRITLWFAVVMLFWSALYFLFQMKEIHDGNDEGLTNLKQEFIAKANALPGFVEKLTADTPLNFIVEEISREDAEAFVETFQTTTVYFATELEKEEVRMLSTAFRCEPNGKYYRLRCFTSTVESDDLIKNMLYLLAALWAVLSLTVIIVCKVVISKANKPFYQTLAELRKFRLDNNTMIAFPETQIKEYRQLNEAVAELLSGNIAIFSDQKQFIENTSHELQTPLAAVIARMESMLEKHQASREDAQEIAGALSVLNRMKRLNASLLLLSKIKNRQFADSSPVDLRALLTSVMCELDELAACKQIAVETQGEASPTALMNEDLACILLTNLAKNAIAHNEPGGTIVLRYEPEAVIIANSGRESAVDPFGRYRSDSKSSGLGLSIAKAIADIYGIGLEYGYEGQMHRFTLRIAKPEAVLPRLCFFPNLYGIASYVCIITN
ncbi:MAG: HAMP domain-containing histidine kinase [Tannerellaceae bacterium]|jgi:signal transduction histidine kinase|nr:HAMP domain-containing histidine kinase [Tannerellaceae bacterium]